MSTIPKEIQTPKKNIQELIQEGADHFYSETEQVHSNGMIQKTNEQANKKRKAIFKKGAYFGYQLATDGREELEKEIERLEIRDDYDRSLYRGALDQITALQSQCTEKEKECEELEYEERLSSQIIESQLNQIEELKAENERLKGLIETAWYDFSALPIHDDFTQEEKRLEEVWQQFKTENNL